MDTFLVGLRVVLALAAVLGLVWFTGRKLNGTPGVRKARTMPLTIIGRQSLGKGSGIALVEVAGRVLLLGIGDQGVRVLTEIDVPAVPVAAAVVTSDEVLALVPADMTVVLREELDLSSLPQPHTDGSVRLGASADADAEADAYADTDGITATDPVVLAKLAGLAASSSARQVSALHGSILSLDTWRRAVDVVQQRTVRR